MSFENIYYDKSGMQAAVRTGRHREAIGGMWEEFGRHQLAFLVSQGLKPGHRLLDVGCGCLRGGLRFVKYLDAGRYCGIDLSPELIEAGREEIRVAGLDWKLPKGNLKAAGDFDFAGLEGPFDFALAQSVFSHLSLNQLRLCLQRLAPHMAVGGRFYVTFFEVPERKDGLVPFTVTHPYKGGEVVTFCNRDPFHYVFRDFAYACTGMSWTPHHVGDWGHPKCQRMMFYERTATA